jgi:hypothetical protein
VANRVCTMEVTSANLARFKAAGHRWSDEHPRDGQTAAVGSGRRDDPVRQRLRRRRGIRIPASCCGKETRKFDCCTGGADLVILGPEHDAAIAEFKKSRPQPGMLSERWYVSNFANLAGARGRITSMRYHPTSERLSS